MEIDIAAEAKDKRLNQWVALTVVILSIVMGISQVKDGNIVQAMAQAQSNAVDRWGEYQATRTKLHIDETALAQAAFLQGIGGAKVESDIAAERARLAAETAKYRKESVELRKAAEGFEAQYDGLNMHDDQFDASDAFLAIAISMAAVAALAESAWVLYGAWGFGAVLMSAAGFLGWNLHSGLLSRLLG